jgi:hypothetical protein
MDFDPTRVSLVDQIARSWPGGPTNILVRGMDPAVSGSFSYDDILNAVRGLGVDPTGKKLVVVNVIDNVGERWAWGPEASAFGVDLSEWPTTDWPPYLNAKGWDPGAVFGSNDLGDLYWWPFEGLPENTDPALFLDSPGWDFSGVVDKVIDLLRTETDALIYFHCMLGADRTGALHTGYLLKEKGMELDAASKIADASTSAGSPNADYARLRAAYAASLKPPRKLFQGKRKKR